MGAEKLFCLCSLERNIITSNYIRQSFECWHFMANGIPRPSAGCNFSQNQFRLIIPSEAEKSAGAKKFAWCQFGQIHPQDISKMKSLKKKVVREVSPDSHLITPELHQVSPEFFFSRKNGKMQNAVPFSCRLKVSPELGISPAGCFSLPWRSKTTSNFNTLTISRYFSEKRLFHANWEIYSHERNKS